MPLKDRTIERIYWTIGETADQLGVNTSLLRYWEKEFGTLRPKRTTKGDRLYTKEDIARIREIRSLLKEQGFTIQGAKDQLKRTRRGGPEPETEAVEALPPAAPVPVVQGVPEASVREAIDRLQRVRQELLAMRERIGHAEYAA